MPIPGSRENGERRERDNKENGHRREISVCEMSICIIISVRNYISGTGLLLEAVLPWVHSNVHGHQLTSYAFTEALMIMILSA